MVKALIKRELIGYFCSPVAYVFMVIFLLATTGTTFFLGKFLDTNQSSLEVFFLYHPWLYLFLIPAVGMRLWAEERHSGTIELLFSLPITLEQAVISKFLAGWIFIGISLALTFPIIFTVAFLGEPDYGVVFSSYVGSFLMAGAYLSISCVTSALTRNQVISFILSVIICFIMVILGWGVFTGMLNTIAPIWLSDMIANFSFTTHFESIRRGVIDLKNVVFFLSIIIAGQVLNAVILEKKKAN